MYRARSWWLATSQILVDFQFWLVDFSRLVAMLTTEMLKANNLLSSMSNSSEIFTTQMNIRGFFSSENSLKRKGDDFKEENSKCGSRKRRFV